MVAELESRGWQVDKIDIADQQHNYYYKKDALDFYNSGVFTRFDLLVHCAYHVGGRASIDGRNMNLAKNLALDAAMFDWAVRTKQPRVLYFSSSAAYPTHYQGKDYHCRLDEDLIDCYVNETPDADYGWAKLTGERLAARAREHGVSVSVVRPFSGYGEDQSLDYPFPSIIRRAMQGDLTVWGPPGQTRDWIHIDDVISGSFAVLESGTADPVNLCTGIGTEMGELMKVAYGEWSGEGYCNHEPIVYYDTTKPTGVFYRVGDPSRLHRYYTPKVSIEEGILRAITGY